MRQGAYSEEVFDLDPNTYESSDECSQDNQQLVHNYSNSRDEPPQRIEPIQIVPEVEEKDEFSQLGLKIRRNKN